MIVVMKPTATQVDIDQIVQRIAQQGLRGHVVVGTERTVIAAIGNERQLCQEQLETGPGVARVMPVLAPYKLASSEVKPDRTVVQAGPLSIGGTKIGVIAGPCSVESEAQIVAVAKTVQAAGATGLRGGAFKPRTSPYSFQGLKEEGLKLLALARDLTGLAIVTEVISAEDVPLVARYADVLQIGARNMQNYRLLEAAGETDRAVLLKRGPSATLEEMLLAAEYILNAGNPNVILCERGVRTFEAHVRFTLPLTTVPYLHQKTHLPVLVDPSHGTGSTSLVSDMSAASIAAGADGLMLEVHPNPEFALSDGYQTLNFAQFESLMVKCRRVAEAVERSI